MQNVKGVNPKGVNPKGVNVKGVVDSLFDRRSLGELLEKLSRAAGVTVSIHSTLGEVIASSDFLPICRDFHEKSPSCSQDCAHHRSRLANELEGGKLYTLSRCPAGLTQAAAAIRVEGERVATLVCGQFLLTPPDRDHFRAQANRLGFPERPYLAAMSEVPVLTPERLEVVLGLLSGLAALLSSMALAKKHEDAAKEALREERERLALAQEAAELGAWELDVSSGHCVYDEGWARMLGYTNGEIDSHVDFGAQQVHPADAEGLRRTRDALRKARLECTTREYRLRHKLGSWVRVREKARIFERDSAGKVLRIGGACTVITSSTHQEESVRQRERELTTLLDHSPEMIMRFDTRLRMVMLNKAVETQLGVPFSSFIGKRPLETGVPREEMEGLERSLREVLESGEEGDIEQVLSTPAGRRFYRARVVPERDEQDSIVSLLAIVSDVTDRRQAEQASKESEERYRSLFEQSGDCVLLLEPTGDGLLRVVDANDAALKAYRYGRDELVGELMSLIDPSLTPELVTEVLRLMETRGQVPMRVKHVRKDGSSFEVESRSKFVQIGEKKLILYLERDISERLKATEERERLQAQLLQVQKMESIGRLAGGVAHDFNNMLGVIIGHAEQALEQLDAGGQPRECLQEILSAAQRSSDLTRQLLAFARRQAIKPQVLDMNDAVEGMLKMLRRLIGEQIELSWKPGRDLWMVRIDPTQLGQVLANLTVNAHDAIKGSGSLSMETMNAVLNAEFCAEHLGSVPGQYVQLVVSDTGAGMDRDVMDHMFEPFFTTKGTGKGTGLGLATVYGIVKQNQGYIWAQSEVGRGTTLRIYLPRTKAAPADIPSPASLKDMRGTETILLVEDEKPMLNLCQAALQRLGYRVLAARSPDEALELEGSLNAPLDMLVTDLVLPGMNGRDLMKLIETRRAGIKVLFISGYPPDEMVQQGMVSPETPLLQKPFLTRALAERVREILDR